MVWVIGWLELDYYSEWYQLAPHWHESIGLLLFIVTVLRFAWRAVSTSPATISSHSTIEKKASVIMIFSLYLLMFIVFVSGYLITCADGKAIAIFNWFDIPAWVLFFDNQEDIAGTIHYYLAYSLMFFALLHTLAALKHHFIDKDNTLNRMIK